MVDKSTYGEKIAELLRGQGIQKVLLVGIDTDVCVLNNATYLFDDGFEVTVDLDACATNGGPSADLAAKRLLGRAIGRDYVLGSSLDVPDRIAM